MGQCDDKDCLNEIVDTMLEIQCSMREYNAVAGDEYLESLFKERLKRTAILTLGLAFKRPLEITRF